MTLEELIAKKKATTRKRPSDEEHRIQCSCVRWFNLKHRKLKGRLFAVPNGGKRDALTGAKLKAEGVVAGVADLILLVPNRFYGALLVEMKTLTGRQSKSQKDWEQIITSEGDYKYVVCHSLDDFIREVDDYIKYCD
ncbi:VRR-NUC domain protein [Prevotella amnii CRIS 21A-A]|uniref:VRR-NUC domain protein n=1 Tax=Prevotella amnii CRIS 21A-A TaxID=679191 RepID=E1GUC8_9BACT|nr:VRR-NUC domain-containing protein [Prevotella amnii]EFN91737.1 VRR-NUC domain protein [Prevotella amnii CRIS 21A-A]